MKIKKKSVGVTIADLKHLIELVQVIDDPRVKARSDHLLVDIIVITVCALICGAETIADIEDFGDSREGWLKTFLNLPNGIPSHDTFSRVISLLEPSELELIFFEWALSIKGRKTKHISVDGKSIKGTERSFNQGLSPLHSVSVYSHELGLTLAQSKSKGSGTSETESATVCLKALNLKHVTVLADAALGTKEVLQAIKDGKGEYILPVKGKNRFLLKDLKNKFGSKTDQDVHETIEQVHGRKEKRICRTMSQTDTAGVFADARTAIEIYRCRETKDKRYVIQTTGMDGRQSYKKNSLKKRVKEETTYYLSSAQLTAKEASEKIRKHWGIENKLHWVLDTAFREDQWRTQDKVLAHNLSLLRRMAFNLVKRMPEKKSVRRKMKMAGWSNDYLENIIFSKETTF